MSIICKIDNRERDLIKLLENNQLIEKKNLDIGDIHICNRKINKNNENEKKEYIDELVSDDDLLVIIERKTYDDLSTSIKDGRYKEQKNRILNSVSPNVRKIYLLEGNKNTFTLPKNVLDGTIINTIIRDNIHIMISKNIDETIKIINNIIKNIDKYKEIIIENKTNCDTGESLINTSKKANMNSETCFINMMSGIPGISKKTASFFVSRFKTINGMFDFFQNTLNNKRDLIISELEHLKVAENKRKLGSKNAERIYKFLYN